MQRLSLLLMLLAGWVCAGEAVNAEETSAVGQLASLDLIDAHREYQAAKLRMLEYRFVTLPQQRRLLDQQAKLAEAEIAMLRGRIRDYQPFLRVGEYSPVRTAAENHQLALLAAEQQLRQTKDDRRALSRLRRQQGQLYQLDVLRAATRLALAQRANK